MTLMFKAIPTIGEVVPGDDLAQTIGDAMARAGIDLQAGDTLVVAQKIVSKAEGRFVVLANVVPSARAQDLARQTGKDARIIELILGESVSVLRAKRNVIVVEHRAGYIMAQAGIDRSNVAEENGAERVLLLPRDCDASAAALRDGLSARYAVAPGVIISDSFGRAWRRGTVNVALGVAGLPALIDARGIPDRHGRLLESSEIGYADAIAAGAGLAMGEAAEGTPAVLVRGLAASAAASNGQSLLRPLAEDMFR